MRLIRGYLQEIGQDMRISARYLIRIVKVLDHVLPFGLPMILDDGLFFIFPVKIHCHPLRVGFRMELGSDHVLIKPDGHDRSFQWHMGPLLFNAEDFGSHLMQTVVVWL